MKHGEAEQWLKQQLQNIYDEAEASAIASIVMHHITRASKGERIMKKDEPLVVQQTHELTEINQRLQQHEPIQYILGEVHFYGLKLFVDNSVLIPRPETEELVDWIVQDIKNSGLPVFERSTAEADKTKTLKILDVGTGSGCIALALKKAMPVAEVWGCDISETALNIARRNGSENNVRVDFQGMNFLDDPQHKLLPTVDIIVSNPPYIPQSQQNTMQANVTAHEPHTALFVPDNDPLVFYKALADFGKERLYENGSIYAEIHEDTGDDVLEVFRKEGYSKIEIKRDMQGKNRMIKAVRNF